MKKLSLFLGMALAASLSLTNCTEKIEGPIAPATPAGIPFEISADISTKTTNNVLATQWAEGDAINLFHAEAGTAGYVSDKDFTLDATRDGVFTGSLAGGGLNALKSYDWYAFYPYSEYNKTPAGVSKETFGYTHIGDKSQTQEGNDSKAHLCGKALPLYGVAKGLASDVKPKIAMNNLASVVAVKVKNTTTEPLVVKSVSFTSTEDIVGTYYIDFTGENVVYTGSGPDYVSATASLTVNNGDAIAANSEATFYIPIKPHSVKKGSILKISVNGYEKPLTLPKDVTFTAGSIKPLAFKYDKVDYVTIPWTEDFSGDLSLYTLVKSGTNTYSDSLAGGTAPELLISKNGGSFSAKVKADAGNYRLTFKRNKNGTLIVSSSDVSVTVTKESDTEYLLAVPEGGSTFSLTIKNTHKSDNARIDDISLVADTAVRVPVITVDNTKVSVKAEGDVVTLKYSIKYPIADATISAASTETWVNTFEYKDPGEITFAVDANEGEARTATITLSYPDAAPVAVTISQRAAGSAAEPVTIIIDAFDLKETNATTTDTDHTFGGVTLTYSKGAKKQLATNAKNAFSDKGAILIGKSGAYIYNKTAIPGVITKFEIYSNKGASKRVSVGINFSNSAISKYDAKSTNIYTATFSTEDSVYDCSASLPKDAKYFWYQVTNANNSQVQFRITYIPEN